jgi:uncharacterized protein YceK
MRRWPRGLTLLVLVAGLAVSGCAGTMMDDKGMKKEGATMKDDKMMEKK